MISLIVNPMEKVAQTLFGKKKVMLFWCKVHSWLYRKISYSSINLENGVHPKHRLLDYHNWFVTHIEQGSSVLDIGCSRGELAMDIYANGNKVTGVEIESATANVAAKNPEIKVINRDIFDCNFKENEFSVSVLSNVLEHIEDRVKLLKIVARISKKVLIRVPMIDRDWLAMYKHDLGADWKLDDTHFIEYTYDSFVNEVQKSGLKLVEHRVRYGELYAVLHNE